MLPNKITKNFKELQHRTDKVRHKNIENKLPRHGKTRGHKVLL